MAMDLLGRVGKQDNLILDFIQEKIAGRGIII
jgi:hypothetical protein